MANFFGILDIANRHIFCHISKCRIAEELEYRWYRLDLGRGGIDCLVLSTVWIWVLAGACHDSD